MDDDVDAVVIELNVPIKADALRALFAEIGLEAKIRGPGRGIDPTWATAITVISVPFSIFFAKFLDHVATDAYGALKRWLSRLLAASPARVELRDSQIPSRTYLFPNDPAEEDYRQLLPHLAVATVWRGRDLEQRRDNRSLDQAEQWYERAFNMDGADPATRCEAACRLVVMLERRGGAEARHQAELWYQRAVDLDVRGLGDYLPSRWVAQLRNGATT